jgi:predicted alpha/beta hydrolase family esterase
MLSPLIVALLLPGLNLKAEKLGDLARELKSEGVESIIVPLDPKKSSEWMPQLRSTVRSRRATHPSTRFVLVAHSLGANLGLNLARELEDQGLDLFDGAFLLAPAVQVQPYTRWVKALFWLGDDFSLSSRNHPDYRVDAATNMAAYRALFDSQKQLSQNPPQFLARGRPCRMLISRSDELVSYTRSEAFAQQHSTCQTHTIDNRASTLTPSHNHLIVDERSLGPSAWRSVQSQLKDWLSEVKSLGRST